MRAVMSLVGVSDISAKMLGSKNKLSNARATIKALELFSVKTVGEIKKEKIQAEAKEKAAAKAVKTETPEKKAEATDDKKAVKPKAAKAKTEE